EIIVLYNNESYFFLKVQTGKPYRCMHKRPKSRFATGSKVFRFRKGCELSPSAFVGAEYGAYFHVSNRALVPADPSESLFALFGLEVDEGERDNRNLKAHSNAQVRRQQAYVLAVYTACCSRQRGRRSMTTRFAQ